MSCQKTKKGCIVVIFVEKKLQIVKLWKTNKPFLFDKIVPKEKLFLIEKDEIVESYFDTAQSLNTFFSNIVSNFKIAEYGNCVPTLDNINNPVIKSIVKYINLPTILKVGEVCNVQ